MSNVVYSLSPLVSSYPANSNIGFNNSWVGVQSSDDPNKPLFAQLTYATNLDDALTLINTLIDVVSASKVNYDTYFNLLTSFTSDIDSNTDNLETLIDSLTSLQNDKQNQIINLIDSLTSIQVDKQDQLIALSHSLSSIQVDKQDQVITLLHQLTANTDELENGLRPVSSSLLFKGPDTADPGVPIQPFPPLFHQGWVTCHDTHVIDANENVAYHFSLYDDVQDRRAPVLWDSHPQFRFLGAHAIRDHCDRCRLP